jgi:serine/threonine protein kinase/tetratricopeptide (TPR) repeat protein
MNGGVVLTGRTLSHYLVLDQIGEGAMGFVYKAEDTRLGRLVALKFLSEEGGAGSSPSGTGSNRPQALQRFWREAQAASALNHPGICTIYAIEEYDGQPFIAMELLEGRTLREMIASASPSALPVDQIIEIAIQIADALDAAHSKGIIHRDLKPANLFVTSRSQAKILDFGLAKRTSRAPCLAAMASGAAGVSASSSSPDTPTVTISEAEVTIPGSTLGTMAYMSPEQAMAEELDARTDLFSLAAVLYEMATGRRAFPGANWAVVGSAILKEDPPPAGEVNPQLPRGFSAIIQKGLAKNREDRYQTAVELRDHVRALRDGSLKRPGRLSLGMGSFFRKDLLRTRASRTWIIAAVAVVLLVGAVLAVKRFRDHSQTTISPQAQVLSGNLSLAVLPFRGAPNDPALQAFGNGLAEALTGRLIQLTPNRPFQVAPACEMRDRNVATLDQARQEFGANVGLDLSVERFDSVVRVTYTLIDASNHRSLNAGTVAVPDSDLLTLADRLEESVVRSLNLELRPDEERTLTAQTPPTLAPQSYNYYLQGIGYLQEAYKPENVESALTMLGQALKLDPQFGRAEAAVGQAYWGKFEITHDKRWVETASAACNQAVKMGNAGAEGHECLGVIANGTGAYAEAATQFQIATQMEPTSESAFSGLGAAYQMLNQPAQAEATYQHAISLRPQYWRGYSMLGAFYSSEQEYDKALAMFSKAVELAPASYRGYAGLGGVYLALDRRPEAIAALERSVAIRPNWAAYSNLGTTYFYLKRYDEAARVYRQAVAITANDYVLWGNLGDADYYGGHHEEAMSAYRQAAALAESTLTVNPKDTEALGGLAGYYSMLGDRKAALAALDRARAAGQPDKDLFFSEALVYNQFGETDVALEWLAKAIAAGLPPSLPRDAPALNNLHHNPRYQSLLAQR